MLFRSPLPPSSPLLSSLLSCPLLPPLPPEALSDALLCWLSRELSEEDLTPLVLSLRLRRSSIQMVRLQAPDSLPAQALHILGLWRRSLPAAPQPCKSSQLAHCLAKSGRPDLAKELLLRQAATRGGCSRALGEEM